MIVPTVLRSTSVIEKLRSLRCWDCVWIHKRRGFVCVLVNIWSGESDEATQARDIVYGFHLSSSHAPCRPEKRSPYVSTSAVTIHRSIPVGTPVLPLKTLAPRWLGKLPQEDLFQPLVVSSSRTPEPLVRFSVHRNLHYTILSCRTHLIRVASA